MRRPTRGKSTQRRFCSWLPPYGESADLTPSRVVCTGEGGAEPLLALGYPLRDPAYLALSDVDLREIERLIGNGRPAETAVRMAG